VNKANATVKTILGITFDERWLSAVVLQRNGNGPKIKKIVRSQLSLDPLTNDPELVGQEIRNVLNEAGIRENQCLLCIPFKWMLTHSLEYPAMSAADEKDFLMLHAEREFPFALDDVAVAISKTQLPNDQQYATMLALQKITVQKFEHIFQFANLKLRSITVGYPGLDPSFKEEAAIVVQQNELSASLFVMYHNSVTTIRTLTIGDSQESGWTASTQQLIREIRITATQISESLRPYVKSICLVGTQEWKTQLIPHIQSAMKQFGLTLRDQPPLQHAQASMHHSFNPLLTACNDFYLQRSERFEFLPPYENPLVKYVQKISSRSNFLIGTASVFFVLITAAAFAFQHWQLSRLETQWASIRDTVAEVESLQNNVKKFKPWFTTNTKTMSAMKTLTEAFPEAGVVWSQIVEIDENHVVSCSGFARSNPEWMAVVDRLRASAQVKDLQIIQVQGENPMQFAMQLRWVEG